MLHEDAAATVMTWVASYVRRRNGSAWPRRRLAREAAGFGWACAGATGVGDGVRGVERASVGRVEGGVEAGVGLTVEGVADSARVAERDDENGAVRADVRGRL